jgi:hypothetical protein
MGGDHGSRVAFGPSSVALCLWFPVAVDLHKTSASCSSLSCCGSTRAVARSAARPSRPGLAGVGLLGITWGLIRGNALVSSPAILGAISAASS